MRGSDLSPKSTEERYRDLYARFRQYHVDIQRLWKRMPPLAQGAYVGAGFPSFDFEPPFDEPSGGTAGSDTYSGCPSRYAGRAYQLASQFTGQPAKTNQWTNIDRAAGVPNDQGATITFPNSLEPLLRNGYYIYTDQYEFAIPLDVTITKVSGYIRYRAPDAENLSTAKPTCSGLLLHVDGAVLGFQSPGGPNAGGTTLAQNDWFEQFVLQSGTSPLQPMSQYPTLTPEIINSSGFGFGFYCLGYWEPHDLNLEIDSIRLEICWETEA